MAKGRSIDGQGKSSPRRKTVARPRVKKTASAARKKAADRAAAKAKEHGAVGVYKDRERLAIRNAAIVARHIARTPHKVISEEFGVSVRQIEDIVRAFREGASPLEQLPMDIVEDYARVMRAAIADLEAMAARQEEINANVALGARKAAQEARKDYLMLLSGLGKLPENMELFRMESELARLGQLVLDALDDVAAGRVSAVEAQERVKDLVAGRQLPAIETTAR